MQVFKISVVQARVQGILFGSRKGSGKCDNRKGPGKFGTGKGPSKS